MYKFIVLLLLALASVVEAPAGESVSILPVAKTAVDCCEIEHFDLALTLCDGIRESKFPREAWKSSPEQPGPHWVELHFANQVLTIEEPADGCDKEGK